MGHRGLAGPPRKTNEHTWEKMGLECPLPVSSVCNGELSKQALREDMPLPRECVGPCQGSMWQNLYLWL